MKSDLTTKTGCPWGFEVNIGNINKTSSSQRKIFTTTKMNVFLHFHIKQFLRLLQYNRRVPYLKKIKKKIQELLFRFLCT